MIDLTPLEVRKKKGDFRRGMRGYDPQSVDDFLDVVADRLEQLVRENAALHERFGRIEDQVNDYRERERALTEALVTAQEMREQMRQQIEREVELKRREAEADAESIRSEAAQTREREEEAIRRLRARQSQFVQSYRAFLERELTELSVMMESLEMGRANTAAAGARQRKRPAPDAKPAAAPPAAAPPATSARPEPKAERKPEPEPEPEPEPLPLLEPKDVALPVAAAGMAASMLSQGDDFERDDLFAAESLPGPELSGGGAPPEKSFDELLNALPGFAGTAEPRQADAEPQAGLDAEIPEDEEEAALLAEVRAEFDAATAKGVAPIALPEPMPEADDVLELIDDVADDEDSDGWMSTLLEGRGDDRSN